MTMPKKENSFPSTLTKTAIQENKECFKHLDFETKNGEQLSYSPEKNAFLRQLTNNDIVEIPLSEYTKTLRHQTCPSFSIMRIITPRTTIYSRNNTPEYDFLQKCTEIPLTQKFGYGIITYGKTDSLSDSELGNFATIFKTEEDARKTLAKTFSQIVEGFNTAYGLTDNDKAYKLEIVSDDTYSITHVDDTKSIRTDLIGHIGFFKFS